MNTAQVFLAVTRDDGQLTVLGVFTVGRGDVLPSGAVWLEAGWWSRPPTAETLTNEIAHAFAGSASKPVRFRVLSPGEVPADRTFRNACRDDGTTLVHDLSAAREIWRDRLRVARAPRLSALDVAYQRADEQQDAVKKARITAEKQVLRDLPADPAIEAATTTEDLKAFWPTALF